MKTAFLSSRCRKPGACSDVTASPTHRAPMQRPICIAMRFADFLSGHYDDSAHINNPVNVQYVWKIVLTSSSAWTKLFYQNFIMVAHLAASLRHLSSVHPSIQSFFLTQMQSVEFDTAYTECESLESSMWPAYVLSKLWKPDIHAQFCCSCPKGGFWEHNKGGFRQHNTDL